MDNISYLLALSDDTEFDGFNLYAVQSYLEDKRCDARHFLLVQLDWAENDYQETST